jgi:hypothetical protein
MIVPYPWRWPFCQCCIFISTKSQHSWSMQTHLGGPAIKMALPAILPCLTISRMIAAAFRAFSCPTNPCEEFLGSRVSTSTPRPRMCEWAAMRFIPLSSLAWGTVVIVYVASVSLVCRYVLRVQLTAAILGLKKAIARLIGAAQ